jgi:hypothetical protein
VKLGKGTGAKFSASCAFLRQNTLDFYQVLGYVLDYRFA